MKAVKKTIHFVVRGLRCSIEFEIDPTRNRPENVYMGLVATFDGGGGQSQDRIRAVGEDYPEIVTLLDLWDEHHLKKPTPQAIKAITAAMDALDGNRYGVAPDVSDAPDISYQDDIIDSRDVIKRIEIYRDALTECGIDPDQIKAADFDPESREDGRDVYELLEEFEALKALEDQAEGYAPDWRYGETLIRDSYFENYARELAEDIGAINKDATWPNNYIDWTAATEALKQDYTSVEFRSEIYWIR